MKIFAIVVTFNGMKWYDRCFGSLRDSETEVETIVIDNASSDETVEYIKRHFPGVYLVESKENLGFAKANNIGIRYAIDHEADYVFLLNQDAWVEKDTLTKLLGTFEDNERVGIASPIHLNGTYSGLDSRFCALLPWQFASDLYLGECKKYYQVADVNAAAWLVSSLCIRKIGGFDTSIFSHCGEDNNYCQRLRYHKMKLIVNTSCTICHDREYRNPNDDINRKLWTEIIRKEEVAERWSNINVDYQMDDIIGRYKWKWIRSMALFSFQIGKKYKEEMEICQRVKESREINKREGMHWLSVVDLGSEYASFLDDE